MVKIDFVCQTKVIFCALDMHFICTILGVKVRNTKMDLNIYGTWRQVTFEKLMMKF